MKRESRVNTLWGVVLGFLLSFGSVGAMVTGLNLQVSGMGRMALLYLGVAAITAALLLLKWGGGILLTLVVAVNLTLWSGDAAVEQTAAMLYKISTFYHGGYGWDLFPGQAFYTPEVVMDIPLGLLGALVSLSATWTVCRRTGAMDSVLLAVVPVAACVVVTDTVPDTLYLFLWLYSLGMLILTTGVRKRNLAQGNTLTLMTAVPVALALGLLLWCNPRDTYDKHPARLEESITNLFQEFPDLWEDVSDDIVSAVDGSVQATQVDLDDLGPRLKRVYPVMEVTASVSGTVYLRGQDYDTYTGTVWTASRHRSEAFPREASERIAGELKIHTRRVRDVLYLPYYVSDPVTLAGGCVRNPDKLTEYTFSMSSLPENWREVVDGLSQFVDEGIHLTGAAFPAGDDAKAWVQLPASTAAWAEEVLRSILPEEGTVTDMADAVGAFVRNSALYDLDTGKMPRGEDDFARWFLEEGETGYCVHFATAATVLLRAAGVNARYVEGYMFQASAGQEVTVTADQAHAWVEYYEPLLDAWIVLEATPADLTVEEETTRPGATGEETTEATRSATLPVPTHGSEKPETPTIPGESETPTNPENRSGGWKWVLWILGAAILAAGVELQRQLRLNRRKKLRRRGNANARALYRWRELAKLHRILKQPPPEDAEAIAQKAKYSHHSVTAEELRQLDGYLKQVKEQLRMRPWYLKFIDKYIFTAY